VRSAKLVGALALSSISATASPASAQSNRAKAIADAAGLCRSLPTAPEETLQTLTKSGWKDSTPNMFGRSMAAMTGAHSLRRGRDDAMVTIPGSGRAPNCQFEFARVSEKDRTAVIASLDARHGVHRQGSLGELIWDHETESISLIVRSPETLTLLWLAKTEVQE